MAPHIKREYLPLEVPYNIWLYDDLYILMGLSKRSIYDPMNHSEASILLRWYSLADISESQKEEMLKFYLTSIFVNSYNHLRREEDEAKVFGNNLL